MERKIIVFTQLQRWFHMHSIHFFVFLTITGLPLLSPSFSGLAYVFGWPVSWLSDAGSAKEILASGMQVARVVHRVMGILFTITAIPFALVMLTKIRSWQIWPERWGVKAILDGFRDLYICYVKFGKVNFGKYNMGQKQLAWFLMIATVIMMATGFMLIFRSSFPEAVGALAKAAHAIFFILIMITMMFHIYLSTHPINRHGLKAMFKTGTMEERYVKEKHLLWYRKMEEPDKLAGKGR